MLLLLILYLMPACCYGNACQNWIWRQIIMCLSHDLLSSRSTVACSHNIFLYHLKPTPWSCSDIIMLCPSPSSVSPSRWWLTRSSSFGRVWCECVQLHFQVVTYLSWAVVKEGSTRPVWSAQPSTALILTDRWDSLLVQQPCGNTIVVDRSEIVPLKWLPLWRIH